MAIAMSLGQFAKRCREHARLSVHWSAFVHAANRVIADQQELLLLGRSANNDKFHVGVFERARAVLVEMARKEGIREFPSLTIEEMIACRPDSKK